MVLWSYYFGNFKVRDMSKDVYTCMDMLFLVVVAVVEALVVDVIGDFTCLVLKDPATMLSY